MESVLHAEFFDLPLTISAPGLGALLHFTLGPHLAPGPGADEPLHLTVTPVVSLTSSAATASKAPAAWNRGGLPVEIQAHDASGAPLLSRTWQGWGNLPPALPPFALWRDRFAVAPAAVVTKDGATVALLASPDTRHTAPAVALVRRGWLWVSGSLLVLDRETGEALPCHLPLQATAGMAAALGEPALPGAPRLPDAGWQWAAVAAGYEGLERRASSPFPSDLGEAGWRHAASESGYDGPDRRSAPTGRSVRTDGVWRRHSPEYGDDLFLARPESFGALVPIRFRCPPPTLVRVCPDAGEGVRLEAERFRPPAWPSEARSALSELAVLRLTLPEGGAAEAARLIDHRLAVRPPASDRAEGPAPPAASGITDQPLEEPCPSAATTRRAHRAGSTASRRT